MAHLWVRDNTEQWAVLPLEYDAFTLTENPPRPIRERSGEGDSIADVLLICSHQSNSRTWVLVAGAGSRVWVNGAALETGIRVVADRDEIRIEGAERFYFSTESLARVEDFAAGDQTLFCPRCKQAIQNGAKAVKCPGCGVWHHQQEELNCWTYSEVCALCAHRTDLDAGFQWTPEEM